MDWITIEGVSPYDGRYELDWREQPFTTREWGWLKRYAGYRPGMLDEYAFTDPAMVAAVAIIALRRNHKIDVGDVPDVWERFQDVPFGATVRWETSPADDGEEETDAGPPPSSSDARPSSNGPSSTTASERSAAHPSPIGHPPSATSVSVPATSAT